MLGLVESEDELLSLSRQQASLRLDELLLGIIKVMFPIKSEWGSRTFPQSRFDVGKEVLSISLQQFVTLESRLDSRQRSPPWS